MSAQISATAQESLELNVVGTGNGAAFNESGGGSVVVLLEVINGNDLQLTITNALNANATNDDPHIKSLGLQYNGTLAGLSLDSFTVLNGTVATPTFFTDGFVTSFAVDFGFVFQSDNGTGRFQAADPDEVVRIIVGTTGTVDLNLFTGGAAHIGAIGNNGSGSATLVIPEPSGGLLTALAGLGFASLRWTRKQR